MRGRGVITSVDGDRARVQVTTEDECMRCPSKGHCGLGASGKREIVVINDKGACVSDQVIFEAESGKVVMSAALIWIVPLLAMIVGYEAAKIFSGGFIPIGAAFLFLGLTFVFLKFLDSRISGGRSFYPHITRIINSSDTEQYRCPEHVLE